MRRLLTLLAFLAIVACKPEVYLGPLDSPMGNWKSIESKYFFNGEHVYDTPVGTYSAISFYKDSLCCIEGKKGVFKWSYSADSLIVDSTIWRVTELSGKMMNLDFLKDIEKASPDTEVVSKEDTPDTYEYKETVIYSDGSKYWYVSADGAKVPCFPIKEKTSDGTETTICWWNTRSDSYIPF